MLAAAGVPPRPSATALEFALRHAPAHGAGDAGPALMELARLQSAAMFAPDPPTADEATAAWEQVDAIRDALRRTVTARALAGAAGCVRATVVSAPRPSRCAFGQPLDERGALGVERAHLGVDVGRERSTATNSAS